MLNGAVSPAPQRRPRALVTLADVAWPVDAGKRLRSAGMIRGLATRYDLDVLVLFADAHPEAQAMPPEVRAHVEVVPAGDARPWRTAWKAARYRLPWAAAAQDWTAVARRIGALGVQPYDLAWFGALEHFERLRDGVDAAWTVVDCDDVETTKLRTFLDLRAGAGRAGWLERVQRRIELPLWARLQRIAVREADRVLVCSELDRARLRNAVGRPSPAPERIVCVPNTYPLPVRVPPRDPVGACTLVVVANFGTDQNLDAAEWTARELLPAVRAAIPEARIRLVGRRPDRIAHLVDVPGLDIVGPVDSVAGELSRAHAVLVPIRFGGGTRLKVLEGFAYEVPVISTTLGCEGIDFDGPTLLLADDPASVADAAVQLMEDPGLAGKLVAAGRSLYTSRYAPKAAYDAIEQSVLTPQESQR